MAVIPLPGMNARLAVIEMVLVRIERLAHDLRADPDGHVLRSATELRRVFSARLAIEPAVARVRDSVTMLRRTTHDGSRREFQLRQQGVEHLEAVMERELLPELRGVGFNV